MPDAAVIRRARIAARAIGNNVRLVDAARHVRDVWRELRDGEGGGASLALALEVLDREFAKSDEAASLAALDRPLNEDLLLPFCACGRRRSECDGSRSGCAKREGGAA